MNSTKNSIEVNKTTPRDFRFSFMSDLFIWGVGLGLGALFSHRFFLCAILFVVYEALHLICILFLLPSRIPYRFEFVDGVVRLYCKSLKKTIVKEIPLELGKINHVKFVPDYTYNPSKEGTGTDIRDLGVYIVELHA